MGTWVHSILCENGSADVGELCHSKIVVKSSWRRKQGKNLFVSHASIWGHCYQVLCCMNIFVFTWDERLSISIIRRLIKLTLSIDIKFMFVKRFYFTPGPHPKASQEVFCMIRVQLQGTSHKPLSLSNYGTYNQSLLKTQPGDWPITCQSAYLNWADDSNQAEWVVLHAQRYVEIPDNKRWLSNFQLRSHFAVLVSRSMKP